MAQETIGIGASANDGTGDPLRTAFTKTNSNFTELYAAVAGLPAAYQPLDSNLSAIAALSTTSFGRSFLTLANDAAGRTLLGLGSIATANTGDYLTPSAAALAYQPLDAELTSLSGASANGVSLVTAANYSAMRTLLGLVPGTDVQSYSSILQGTTASFTTAQETKLGHITVTQAVDLDAIETRVNALDAAVILRGSWDASAGTFPGSGTAQAGDSYIVSVGGTVDSVVFAANDRIIAVADNASTSTFAANWFKADYTDAVLSVAGRTGAVTLALADVTDASANGRSLVGAADYAAMRALLDLEAGTDFYSKSAADLAFQPLDQQLSDLAALTPTKGRLAVADGTNWLPLTVGTNTHVLTADSAEALGVKWAAPGGGGSPGGSSGQLQWNDSSSFNGSYLWQTTNVIEQRNGTNGQSFRVYRTYTDASNYTRGVVRWDGDVLVFGTEKAGTGPANNSVLSGDGTTVLMWGGFAGGFLSFYTNLASASAGAYDLGAGAIGGAFRNLHITQFIETFEMSAPSAPAANGARIYTEDNGSGKTRLMVRFQSGAAQQLAIEP